MLSNFVNRPLTQFAISKQDPDEATEDATAYNMVFYKGSEAVFQLGNSSWDFRSIIPTVVLRTATS